MIRLDTHVVVWLFAGSLDQLSPVAYRLLDEEQLAVSPMVELELTYLHEIGRINPTGTEVVADLADRIGLATSGLLLSHVVAEAKPLSWTRDPFDRMIVADAIAAGEPLLTRDEHIRAHAANAIW